jgi:hypothetical protein
MPRCPKCGFKETRRLRVLLSPVMSNERRINELNLDAAALVCCVISLLLGGCAGTLKVTKWECQTGACLPREQAINKCVAQANAAAFASESMKVAIWEQCMHDEGFKEVACTPAERTDPDCHLFFFH